MYLSELKNVFGETKVKSSEDINVLSNLNNFYPNKSVSKIKLGVSSLQSDKEMNIVSSEYKETNTTEVARSHEIQEVFTNRTIDVPPPYEVTLLRSNNKTFQEEKNTLLKHEKEYINNCLRVQQDPNFAVYLKNGLSVRVCGLLEELISFHENVFLKKLQFCESHDQLAFIFTSHKDDLYLHIKSEWEIYNDFNYIVENELKLNFDYYNISGDLIKHYLTCFKTIQLDKTLVFDYKYDLVVCMLKQLCEQIFYVKNGIRLIIGNKITYEQSGLIVCTETMKLVKRFTTKNVHVFFTEKYIIVSEALHENYMPVEFISLSAARLQVGPKFDLLVHLKKSKKDLVLATITESSWKRVEAFVLKQQNR